MQNDRREVYGKHQELEIAEMNAFIPSMNPKPRKVARASLNRLLLFFGLVLTLNSAVFAELVFEPTCYKFDLATFSYVVIDCNSQEAQDLDAVNQLYTENSDSLMFQELLRYSIYASDTAGISLSVGYNVITANSYSVGNTNFEARIGTNGTLSCDGSVGDCDPTGIKQATFNGPLTVRGDLRLLGVPSAFNYWVKVMSDLEIINTPASHTFHDNLFVQSSIESPYSADFLGDTVMVGEHISLEQQNDIANTLYVLDQDSINQNGTNSIGNIVEIDSFSAPKPEGYFVDGLVPRLNLPDANITTSDVSCSWSLNNLTWTRSNHAAWGCSSLSSAYSNGHILQDYAGTLDDWFAEYGDDVLPPGRYGTFSGGYQGTIILGEGRYYFDNFDMGGSGQDGIQVLYRQPNGGRTEIFIDNNWDLAYDGRIAPESSPGSQEAAIDTSDSKGGSLLLYYNGTDKILVRQALQLWATVVAPNAEIEFQYANKVFGQIWAKRVVLGQNFNGNAGVFIPYYPERPKVSFVSSSNLSQNEGNSGTTEYIIDFSLDHINGLPIKVYYHLDTTVGTHPATPGTDYEYLDTALNTLNDSITIPAMELSRSDTILVFGDTDFENNETIRLVIDSVVNADIAGNGTAVLIILNDDAPANIEFSSGGFIVPEDTGTISIPIVMDAVAQEINAVVQYTVGGSAGSADHNLSGGTITIPAGDFTGNITFDITDDLLDEPDETIVITLVDAGLFNLSGQLTSTITIEDNDGPVGFSEDMAVNFGIDEGDSVLVTITLDTISGFDVSFDYAPELGSGTVSSSDYSQASGSISIPAGELSASFRIKATDDIINESDELLIVRFSNPSNIDFGTKDSLGVTIFANDPPIARDTAFTLAENPDPGYVIGTLVKHGPDTANYTIALASNEPYRDFFNLSAAGVLSVVDSTLFDYELRSSFSIRYILSGPLDSDEGIISINVTDLPENPIIISGDDTIYVTENTPGRTPVDTVTALPGAGDTVWYFIEGGSGSEIFTIDSVSGIIRVAPDAIIDFEEEASYSLDIVVRNPGGFDDRVTLPVQIVNVAEFTQVEIISASGGDSTWSSPDTIYFNQDSILINYEIEGGEGIDTLFTELDEGKNLLIVEGCVDYKEQCGTDTVIVMINTQEPVVVYQDPSERDTTLKYTVYEEIPNDGKVYVNDEDPRICVAVTYINQMGETDSVNVCNTEMLEEGDNVLTFQYKDPYGNIGFDTLQIVLDTEAPVVVILDPENKSETGSYVADVVWTVDSDSMDVLNKEGLLLGDNRIIRGYMDRAGNYGADTVFVKLNETRNDVVISLERPLVESSPEKVSDFRSDFPKNEDETYTLTLLNQQTGDEEEVLYGRGNSYTTLDETRIRPDAEYHAGPTLVIEVNFPHIGGVNAAGESRGGTLGELIESLENSDWGQDRTTAEIWDFVLGSDGEKPPAGTEDTIPIWELRLLVQIEIYDNIGQWVDRINVDFSDLGPQHLSDEGVAVFYLNLEPDEVMGLITNAGRKYGTGAYIMRGFARKISTARYNTPDYNKGTVLKKSETLLSVFGYRRDNR